MKKGLRSLIVIALIVSLGTGSILFVFPKKVDAGMTDCLAGVLFGQTKGKAEVAKAGKSGFGQTVPVKDATVKAMVKANANINANTSGQTQGFTVQRCIVEPLVTIMVRSLLNTFTAQTISWINSGFKGSPLYVTNPEGFLADIADQSLGQFIGGLGDIGQILCSPFDQQLRLSLNLQFNTGGGYYQEIGCRLTDIQQNLQKTFTGGSFGADGWDNWIQLTAQPQNNPYGAFIKASESLSSTIGNRQETSLRELDWGKGFLSSTDPETGEVNTPGSLIEDQLSTTLGVEVQRVGLAKDIDAILGALANQLINQVMGGVGGLLGASRRSGGHTASSYPSADGTYSSSVQSPVERARNSTPAGIIAANEAAQGLPDGLFVETSATAMLGPTATDEFGKPTGPTPIAFCAAFKRNLYSASKAKPDDPLTGTTPIVVKIGGVNSSIATTTTKKGSGAGQWNLADYNRVATFCQSVNMTAPIRSATRDFSEQTKGEDTTGNEEPPEASAEENLARGKPARQSSDWVQRVNDSSIATYPASRAVKGVATGVLLGGSVTNDGTDNWWTVDLGKIYKIYKINVYEFIGRPFSGCVIISKTAFGSSPQSCAAGNNTFPLPSPTSALTSISTGGTEGQYVWIQQMAPRDNMILDEVQVFGAPKTGTNDDLSTPSVVFSPAEQESKPNIDNYYNLTFRNFLSMFKMTANQRQTGLKARLKLLGIRTDGSIQTPQFSSVFAPDSLQINELPVDVQQSSVVFNNNFDLTQGRTVDYKITARIADNPIFTSTGTYLSYKMVMEFFKVVNDREQSIASSTTMFKIQ